MDACLIEPAPAREILPAQTPAAIDVASWLRYGLIATICVGLIWRVVRYLGGFPIWGDEAMLLLNILERDYAGLTQHLRFAQVAPLFFLWLEKTAILLFGTSEWSVHLFPFLAGLASLLIFWRMCRSSFAPVVAGLAVAILAISYYPVRHSTEVKPYAFDLLYAIIFAWMTLEHLRSPASSRWLIALAALTPIAVFSSYPSVFVGGAVSLVLLMRMRDATWTQRGLYVLFNVLLCGSFLVHYGMVGQQQIDVEEALRTREFLRNYWKDAFPPEDVIHWPIWLVKMFTGNMLAYPMGGHHGASTGTFFFVVIGSVVLWRTRRRSLLALCWLPFAFNLLAAMLNKYPFGDSARITLHLAPFICILMAHAIAEALGWIRTPIWRTRCELALCAALIAFGVIGAARDVFKPYKTEHDRAVRELARDLRRQIADDDLVFLCHQHDEELIAEFLWYVRTRLPNANWLHAAAIPPSTRSCWLIMSGNQEPSESQMVALLGGRGWRAVESDVRMVPPENAKTPPMVCRWLHVVRE